MFKRLTKKQPKPVISASLITVLTITAAAFYDALDTMNASFLQMDTVTIEAQEETYLSNEYYCIDLTV